MDTTKYELRKEPDGYSFSRRGNVSARSLLASGAQLVWTVEAKDWNEAQAKKHDFLGWEPTSPCHDEQPGKRCYRARSGRS
jgi:hypothetical protein